ncbi:hypothetical protein VE02_09097 [Pseudogymnoascus sp. 03VT05]|nr:hypothetical protein VE02_09097 [Pseudogymnoascus sp. 03VT05]
MSALTTPKTVLVIGATGKQGGAVIENILASPQAHSFNIVAVTRDAASRKAQKLAAHPNVSVIEGDLANVDNIFNKTGPVWGVYSVQVNSDVEEQQGKAMADAAVMNGAQHFVYSSGDRGGPERLPNNPTYVKNFAAKHAIEKRLQQRAEKSPQQMTIQSFAQWPSLRISPRIFMVKGSPDIGWFAAQSFLQPDKYKNTALTLVGDEMTQPEANVVYKKVTGQSMVMAACPIASAVKFVLKGSVGNMFKWFEDEGYGGNVQECRNANHNMQDFDA